MNKVSIIDYDAGNTLSVAKALEYLGMKVELTRDIKSLASSDKIIFPGVGAYFDAMNKLKQYELIDTIKSLTGSGIPFLGICLGMQLLFDSSEETIGLNDENASKIEGLGILPGKISRFNNIGPLKIPHMGWNSIKFTNSNSRLFNGIPDESYVYFVHSYYLKSENPDNVAATAFYGHEFDCAVERGNIFGCQFHPEKSGDIGLQILKNFCEL